VPSLGIGEHHFCTSCGVSSPVAGCDEVGTGDGIRTGNMREESIADVAISIATVIRKSTRVSLNPYALIFVFILAFINE